MNEKLEKFAHEAGLIYILQPSFPYIQEDLGKFAELIIKECANICYQEKYNVGSAYGEEILEHFGLLEDE